MHDTQDTNHPFFDLSVPEQPEDPVRHELIKYGAYYEFGLMELVKAAALGQLVPSKGKLGLLDVGCNAGVVSFHAAALGSPRVVCVEPNPILYTRLRMSRVIGGGFTTRHVNIINAGASDKAAAYKLLIASSFGMARVTATCPVGSNTPNHPKCVDIEITNLDSVLTQPAKDVRVEQVAAGWAARTDGDLTVDGVGGGSVSGSSGRRGGDTVVGEIPALLGAAGTGAVYTGAMMMKVDVEGHEPEAMAGLPTLLSTADLGIIYMEMSARLWGTQKTCQVLQLLHKLKFDVCAFDEAHLHRRFITAVGGTTDLSDDTTCAAVAEAIAAIPDGTAPNAVFLRTDGVWDAEEVAERVRLFVLGHNLANNMPTPGK
jgi:FkbM family methyltransferase